MLIVAELNDCDALVNSLECSVGVTAMSRLLDAHRDGLHVLSFPPNLCRQIEDNAKFSEQQRATAKKVRIKYPMNGSLWNKVTVFGKVVIGQPGEYPTRCGSAWTMPIQWIAKRPLLETQVIGEDLHDAKILVHAANDYLVEMGLHAFRVRGSHIAGGGGNTARVLHNTAVDSDLIAICLTDSDRRSPTGDVGTTARRCKTITGLGLFDVRLTLGRSIENALPWQLLDAVHPRLSPSPSQLLGAVEKAVRGSAKFVELKSGMFFFDIVQLSGTPCETFWRSVRSNLGLPSPPSCCPASCQGENRSDCQDRFIAGLGSNTLAFSVDWLDANCANSPQRIAFQSSSSSAEWSEIGAWVAAYALAMPKLRL
jgi:hypothetical protein